ncbi:MAG TPA: hypothetical protein VK617_03320 [Gemmatimonadaceae bacterium]|nr:hypothetical protein [Gemmatimonadaceae bacterium]
MTTSRMSRNQKLTPIIKGRTITKVLWDGPAAQLHFGDGSVLRIHTVATPAAGSPHATLGKVLAVRQSLDAIAFDLEGPSSLQFALAEPTSCVMLRDAKGALEYAD